MALSRSLALEEAKNGITVNVVNPSSIDENELTLGEARRIRDARFPIGRPPTVEDVAASVAFFASEEAEYVTGQVINVQGGNVDIYQGWSVKESFRTSGRWTVDALRTVLNTYSSEPPQFAPPRLGA